MSNDEMGSLSPGVVRPGLDPSPATLDVSETNLAIVRAILRRYLPAVEVRAFGSRVKGTARPFSDLDLVVVSDSELPVRLSALIADAFAESELPFRVDLLDANVVAPGLRQSALADSVIVQAAARP
jgi:type I restriction enzyme S subunit